jgi:hypothetical protein
MKTLNRGFELYDLILEEFKSFLMTQNSKFGTDVKILFPLNIFTHEHFHQRKKHTRKFYKYCSVNLNVLRKFKNFNIFWQLVFIRHSILFIPCADNEINESKQIYFLNFINLRSNFLYF